VKIRMKMEVAGTFHGLEGVKTGDVVDVDDENGARYCALGYATPVAADEEPPVELRDADLPKGNASREEWEAYALGHGATAEDLESLGRDEIRDQFTPGG
jgi:DNA helicase TIP49 (TBP-interacting protein)